MRDTREPLRLRDEGATALERALLEAGASYRSSSAARVKSLTALGVAGSATLLAGAAQAASPGLLAKLANVTWGKLLAAVSIVGAAAAVPSYYAWQHHQAAERTLAASEAPGARSEKRLPPIPTPLLSAVTGEQVHGHPAPNAIAYFGGGDPQPAAGESAGHVVRPSVTLARELSTLDAARGMLARGDAAGALARLDGYTRRYPHGRLGLEAEVLRIDALDASGRSDTAHARAEAFLARHPHSVLAARVRARLAD